MFEIGLIIAVVIGINELFKRVFSVSGRYLPLISLLLGIATGVFYLDGDIKTKIFYGIIIGLSASGLFDQSKIVTKGRNRE
jgi:hypothetical protein